MASDPDIDPFTPGFGTFQGIPNRTLPDDTMEYAVYLIADDPTVAKAKLKTVKQETEKLVEKWVEGYIWQREGFSLDLVEVEMEKEKTWCLKGRTEYGDSVEDEWFVVWMLREISKRWEEVWIRVYDTDGEFLLIEAANALPKWLNPEIADHRVWLHANQLLIIPLSASPSMSTATKTAPISRSLTLPEALTTLHAYIVSKTTTTTTMNPLLTRIRLVEEEALYRTSRYPSAASSNQHRTPILVPRTVAHILNKIPSSVAAATEAFYLRDPISLKALSNMRHFKPGDDVVVTATFTKVLYAQLKGQEFRPPLAVGFKLLAEGADGYNAADIGMKLACGFEMLLSDAGAPQLSSSARRKTVDEIRALLVAPTLPTDAEIKTWPVQEDKEDWLDVDFAEFEHTLQGRAGHPSTQGESGWGDKGAEENLKRMVERFEAFLNDDNAGVDGAEMGDEMDRDNDDDSELNSDDDESDVELGEDEEDREVSFDEKEFERVMREMMGLPADDTTADNEEAEIKKVMRQVEEELREAGALESTAPPKRIKEVEGSGDDDEESEGEIDIDYNLAANLLESFKGQVGLAGPGGNLLARMGIGLPRDEGESEEKEKGRGREIGGERMK